MKPEMNVVDLAESAEHTLRVNENLQSSSVQNLVSALAQYEPLEIQLFEKANQGTSSYLKVADIETVLLTKNLLGAFSST